MPATINISMLPGASKTAGSADLFFHITFSPHDSMLMISFYPALIVGVRSSNWSIKSPLF